jgi:hypothetical protein
MRRPLIRPALFSFHLAPSLVYASPVPDLEPSDRFLIEAASGWLMLGNSAEALRELAAIPAARRLHPDVLLAEWDIHACNRDWPAAIAIGERLRQLAPERPDGFVKKAFALHELKRTNEAWDCLYPVRASFPDQWIIPYNLACYACQLGDNNVALRFLKEAARLVDSKDFREMALNDSDLRPLAAEVEKL